MQMIQRRQLLESIRQELPNTKIVYLEAPCGWGKTVLLHQLKSELGEKNCTFLNESDLEKEQTKEDRIFLVDNLGDWIISDGINRLKDLIDKMPPGCRFVLAGRIPLPSLLFPYKMTSQIRIYDKERLKFTRQESEALYSICSDRLSQDEWIDLYEICRGMPLFLTMAQNLLEETMHDEQEIFRPML